MDGRILIIEDEPDFARSMSELLEGAGHRVVGDRRHRGLGAEAGRSLPAIFSWAESLAVSSKVVPKLGFVAPTATAIWIARCRCVP